MGAPDFRRVLGDPGVPTTRRILAWRFLAFGGFPAQAQGANRARRAARWAHGVKPALRRAGHPGSAKSRSLIPATAPEPRLVASGGSGGLSRFFRGIRRRPARRAEGRGGEGEKKIRRKKERHARRGDRTSGAKERREMRRDAKTRKKKRGTGQDRPENKERTSRKRKARQRPPSIKKRESMREVLMPYPVVVVCVDFERSKEKFSSDL